MENYPWPATCASNDLPCEIAHIVGVIVINWNWCEFVQADLLRNMMGGDSRIAIRIVDPMGNRQRSDLFSGLLAELPLSAIAKDHLGHFLKCFDAGRENRNLIVHALVVPETAGPIMENSRVRQNFTSRYIPVEAELLVGVADELSAIYEYGSDIDDSVFAPRPLPLPEKPPLPRKLTEILPAHIIERYQPPSSDE